MDVDRADLIYHESQQSALCGVHAVNTLLQAPHFSEVEMAQIAQELDAAERELMASGGLESADYLQYVAEGSSNVAENGMFSIQVLSKALEVWGLQAVPLRSPDAAAARADPTTQDAFICNLEEHWFTVRKIHDQWWNLNSIYSAPEPLSAFHLSAYLGSLQEQGYTIFVIVGVLPPSQPPESEAERAVPGVAGRWFTPEEARAATAEREQVKRQGYAKAAAQGVLDKASERGTWLTLRRPGAKRALEHGSQDGAGFGEDVMEDDDDPDLARALAATLAEAEGRRPHSRGSGGSGFGGAAGGASDDEDADLAAAIAASLADHSSTLQPPPLQQLRPAAAAASARQASPPFSHPVDADDEDADLAAAIAASLQPPAAAPQQQQQQQQQQKPAHQEQHDDPQHGDQQEQQDAAREAAAPADDASAATAAAAAAAAPSLPELSPEPEAGGEGVIEVALRLPSGGRVSRRFHSGADTVGHLVAFAAAQGADVAGGCQLAAQFPRRVFADWAQTLAAAGVGNKEMVAVEAARMAA